VIDLALICREVGQTLLRYAVKELVTIGRNSRPRGESSCLSASNQWWDRDIDQARSLVGQYKVKDRARRYLSGED
jgi:hypothetical protein